LRSRREWSAPRKSLVAELLVDEQMLQDTAKKVVSPDREWAAADYLSERYRVSQRRVCRNSCEADLGRCSIRPACRIVSGPKVVR
jgi:hypothetical protein